MKRNRKDVIGDSGVQMNANLFGQSVVVVCILITLTLIVLGVAAIITYVR